MAIISTLTNNFTRRLIAGEISFDDDVFAVVLLYGYLPAPYDNFVFDPSVHGVLSDVQSYMLPSQFGYTYSGLELSGISITENDVANKIVVTWNNPLWALTGTIGPAGFAILFDKSAATIPIVGCIDFGEGIETINGDTIEIRDLVLDVNNG